MGHLKSSTSQGFDLIWLFKIARIPRCESDPNLTALNLLGYSELIGMNYETHKVAKETLF